MNDQKDEQRNAWARRVAEHVVIGALAASEGQPIQDQESLMREIARRALWRMADALAEARNLVKELEVGS
jgi:hypothetical protein